MIDYDPSGVRERLVKCEDCGARIYPSNKDRHKRECVADIMRREGRIYPADLKRSMNPTEEQRKRRERKVKILVECFEDLLSDMREMNGYSDRRTPDWSTRRARI